METMRRIVAGAGPWMLALGLMTAPATAQQRPLLTEDPEPVGDGLVLLEAGFDHAWDQTFPVSGLTGDLLRGPVLGISVGLGSFAEVQIDGLASSRLLISSRDADAPLAHMLDVPGDTTRSWDDLVVGTKVKIVSERTLLPSFALRFATRLPNASNEAGLGPDTIDFFQSLLIGKTMQSVRVVGNIGLGILSDPTRGDRQNDVLTYSISLAKAFAPGAEIVGEMQGLVSTRTGVPPPGTESHGRMTFGVRFTRGPVRIDGGFFTGTSSRGPAAGLTGGLTWVFTSPLHP